MPRPDDAATSGIKGFRLQTDEWRARVKEWRAHIDEVIAAMEAADLPRARRLWGALLDTVSAELARLYGVESAGTITRFEREKCLPLVAELRTILRGARTNPDQLRLKFARWQTDARF